MPDQARRPADEQPTPARLAERARLLGANGGSEQDVLRLIADAEAGGERHVQAVADQVAHWPAGPSEAPYPGVYDPRTGRPAWRETNILLSVSVRIDGRRFTAREMLDPMLLDLQFGGIDTDRFEDFVRHFIRRSFGAIADADEESYQYLRGKLFVVEPGDEHDLERCLSSTRDREGGQWPRCVAGFVVRSARAPGYASAPSGTHVVGVCPCRCHRDDAYGAGARRTAARHGIATFDEDRLDDGADG